MKTILVFVLLSTAAFLHAQDVQKMSFSSVNKVALVTGQAGESFALQTINGVKLKSLFAGVGVGIDFYGQRSIPVFLGMQKDFTNGLNKPFLYADAGISFRCLKAFNRYKNSSSSPGLYYEIGAGWKIGVFKKTGILLSAGYSYKQLTEKVDASWYSPVEELKNQSFEEYNYKYRRIMIKLGVQL